MTRVARVLWFASRPAFWGHALELARRKLRPRHDGETHKVQAHDWASARVVPVAEALAAVGLTGDLPTMPSALMDEAAERVKGAGAEMGGAGDLSLIHAAVMLSGAERVIETGVAYGWSSLAILSALEGRDGARLVSVDMPYPGRGNEPWVGIAVPDRLREKWTLLRIPDRPGVPRAISAQGGTIDLAHYDSDKSWYGRAYAIPLLWEALVPGGILIVDDIQDNMGFAAFVDEHKPDFAVTTAGSKFAAILRKPVA